MLKFGGESKDAKTFSSHSSVFTPVSVTQLHNSNIYDLPYNTGGTIM